MRKMMNLLAGSPITQALMTMIVYGLYAVIIGVSLVPSVYLLGRPLATFITSPLLVHALSLSLAAGAALFLYFITGIVVMGLVIRILSLGIKPGSYPFASFTMLRWMAYSGVYHLAGMTILAYVPMSFMGIVFFRLMGARIGKNVQINTWFLNDAYLLEIGDNVMIGGKTDISCHTVENGKLILQRVRIGRDTQIGQRCYVSPGVEIGRRCVIGQYAFIRKNKRIPDSAVLAAIAGLPIREVTRIEKNGGKMGDHQHALSGAC
jgi:carbonic anhydrase/acetyltransferase-like protein (isoleucine patch superfamily)